jgi:hypothetical protein
MFHQSLLLEVSVVIRFLPIHFEKIELNDYQYVLKRESGTARHAA